MMNKTFTIITKFLTITLMFVSVVRASLDNTLLFQGKVLTKSYMDADFVTLKTKTGNTFLIPKEKMVIIDKEKNMISLEITEDDFKKHQRKCMQSVKGKIKKLCPQ